MIDDNGNVTLYLYDDLNRQVLESEGLVVDSTYTEANILGSRVIPTPTAATIDNPATIPDSLINAQLAEAQSLIAAVASLFPPLADQVNDSPPTTTGLGLFAQRRRPDLPGSRTAPRPSPSTTRSTGRSPSGSSAPARTTRSPATRSSPRRRSSIPTVPGNTTVVQGTTIQNFQYDGLSRMTYAFDNNDPTTAGRRLDGHRRLRQPGPDHRGDADDRQPADPGDRLGLARRRPPQA